MNSQLKHQLYPQRTWINNFSQKPSILKVLFYLVTFTLIACSLAWIGNRELDKNEIIECHKWQRQAKEYKNFYMTLDEISQCKAHGILFN